jgi:predicted O-methyltransferase YrrM
VDLRYWGRAVKSLARHARDKEFMAALLTSGLRADTRPQATPKFILRAFPELRGRTVSMGDVRYTRWNMDPMEQYFLAALAAHRQPRTIFEIGTFDGSTTLLLARAAPDAQVFTLDLPPDSPAVTESGTTERLADMGSWGARFHDHPEAGRITQLLGDSRQYDFSPYYGRVDLVVVDGGHSADCVIPDTENALRMLAPGGVVVWDDYEEGWPGVFQSVDAVARRRGLTLVRLDKTGIAVYDATKSPAVSGSSAPPGNSQYQRQPAPLTGHAPAARRPT